MKHFFFMSKRTLSVLFFTVVSTTLFADCIYQSELLATSNEDGNYLTWSTSSETNNQNFIIERSKNGIDFEQVGKVNAAGTTKETKEYSFSDLKNNKVHTRNFYRLVQVDFDGKTTFSHVAVLTRNKKARLFNLTSLNSSIVDRYFNLNINSSVKNKLSYNVQTQMGEILLKGNIDVTKGDNAISVDMKGLEVGRYQFAIKVKNEINVIQIKKVNSSEVPALNLATKNKKN